MDALELLKQDHDRVDGIFKQFMQGGDSRQFQQLFEQLRNELTTHTRIEETVFYPALQKYPEFADMLKEAYQEHAGAKQELAQLAPMDNTTNEWSQLITKLMQDVKHHVAEEESELFPKVRQKLDEQQLQELGRQLQQAKQSLGGQMLSQDYGSLQSESI